MRIKMSGVVILLVSLLVPIHSIAHAENADIETGISLYKRQNYDEALVSLKKARDNDPKSTLAAYYLGITYKQLQDYVAAEPVLIDAVTNTPKIKEAAVELIEVLYQLGKFDEAKSYIGIAEKENIKPAQVAFLKGLVLLKENDNDGAVTAFEKAKELDSSMSSAADYQIGIAKVKNKKFDEARKVFQDIIIRDPNSQLANFSNQYVEALKQKEKADRLFRATVKVGGEYDTNVLLKPGDDTIAVGITDEADWREVVNFQGQLHKKFTDRFGIDGQYFMYLTHQNKIGAYDILSHTVTVTPNYYFDRATLGLVGGYNYTEVGSEKYMTTITGSPVLNYVIGKNHLLQSNFRYQKKDFQRTPIISDEDRNSNNYGGGLGYYFFFSENKGFVGLRYSADKDNTDGRNWEYLGNRITGSILYPFMKKFKISLAGDAYLQDFSNTNSVFNTKRDDKTYTLSSMLAYNFWKEAELQFNYTYVKAHSNISVYGYDRSIYGIGIEYKF
jgi:tetratricopeptide (TPR) repeat protein